MFNGGCAHGKGQHQLGQGEWSFKEVQFSRLRKQTSLCDPSWVSRIEKKKQTWLVTHHWLSVNQLCSRALRLIWKTMKRYPRTNPGPFAIGPSGIKPATPHSTSRGNHQILSQRDQLQAVGLLLWLGASRHWCRCRKYYICPEPLHQLLNYPPKLGCHMLALQGMLRSHLVLQCC